MASVPEWTEATSFSGRIINYFEYDNFVDILKEIIIGKNEKKILVEIMNKFYNNEYLMNLNNKIKTASQALKNIKKLNENDIDYNNNDEFEIINDKVKNFINDLIGDIIIEDRKFLFGDQKIIMDYKFVKNYFIIGNFENSTFKSEIMLNFEQQTGNYFSIFQAKGYNDFINELKLNNNLIITSENQKIKEIKIKKNYQFSSKENHFNEGNTNNKFNHDFNNGIQNKNLPSSNNNKNIINNGKKENPSKSMDNKINYKIFLIKNDDTSNIKNDKNILKDKNRGAKPGNNINIMIPDFYFMNSSIERMNTVLKNILSIIIDSEKIQYKMKMPLNSGNSDEYYLLNYDWFKIYLELNNVYDIIYEHLVNLVKNNINISNISNNKIKNEMLINNIIPKLNSNIKLKIKKEKENYYRLNDNELCNLCSSLFNIKGYIALKYYYNFIIISPETMDLLMKDFSFQYGKNLILFGDNKAFIKRKKQLLIEICFINNKNIFVPELIFYFEKESILNNNLNLLQNEGYEQYFQYNLLFNNDYASPIFDKNNDNIGYAFK